METTLVSVGVAVAFCAFFVTEGLVVGKLLQPAVFFVAYVSVLTPPWPIVGVVLVGCALGATIGQWVLYRAFTPTASAPGGDRWSFAILDRLPGLVRRWLGRRWIGLVERQVDRFGALGVVVCTALPVIRTVVPIVAGLSAYPERRYAAAAGAGNLAYMLLLLGAARGVLGLGRLFVGI
ncbi:DedA family protein [Halovivax sp.]|uniref:DedA family protein n=1 Tax=Halovivax sp. TaxID=1935978 RepID=UPI0025B912B8|nr:VTT domain-containing protein [Halovivax sp.]